MTSAELDGTPGDGRTVMWARMPEVLDMSGAALAILGDYVPMGVGQALGLWPAATASTTRSGSPDSCRPTGSCSTSECTRSTNGFGHGLVHLWAQDGTLLGDGEPVVHRPVLEGPRAAADAMTPRRCSA